MRKPRCCVYALGSQLQAAGEIQGSRSKRSPGERAAWKKEIAIMKARDLRFAALRKRYNGAPIPIEELRRAFNGK